MVSFQRTDSPHSPHPTYAQNNNEDSEFNEIIKGVAITALSWIAALYTATEPALFWAAPILFAVPLIYIFYKLVLADDDDVQPRYQTVVHNHSYRPAPTYRAQVIQPASYNYNDYSSQYSSLSPSSSSSSMSSTSSSAVRAPVGTGARTSTSSLSSYSSSSDQPGSARAPVGTGARTSSSTVESSTSRAPVGTGARTSNSSSSSSSHTSSVSSTSSQRAPSGTGERTTNVAVSNLSPPQYAQTNVRAPGGPGERSVAQVNSTNATALSALNTASNRAPITGERTVEQVSRSNYGVYTQFIESTTPITGATSVALPPAPKGYNPNVDPFTSLSTTPSRASVGGGNRTSSSSTGLSAAVYGANSTPTTVHTPARDYHANIGRAPVDGSRTPVVMKWW